MKTTIEIPDEVLRQAKAVAALRGTSLKDLVSLAIQEHLERSHGTGSQSLGWRKVFGRARKEELVEVDELIDRELSQVDPDDWR